MFINIGGALLVLTLTCHTQNVKETSQHVRETTLSPDGYVTVKEKQENSSKGPKKKEWKFEDYMKKFEPSTIWEQIDKQKKYNGLVISDEEQSEIMYRAMDPTDELMELKIENGDPKIVTDGRRHVDPQGWRPPKVPGFDVDKFYLRNRLYELMKQAIYESRNKMVIMQIYREKYLNSSLYKMGFLFNKADNAAKTFSKFSFRAYRACLLAREKIKVRFPIYDLLAANERQMNLWFNVELLADLIENNDLIARQIYANYTTNRLKHFDKKFIE